MYPPPKALLQENACLEHCTVHRGAETELPWNATWPCWSVSRLEPNTMEELRSLPKVCSHLRYIDRALFYQINYEFYFTLGSPTADYPKNTLRPILYNSGPGPLIWYPQSSDYFLRPQLPLQYVTHVPTRWFLSRWLVKVVRTSLALLPLCSLNTQLSKCQPRRSGLHVLTSSGKIQEGKSLAPSLL